MMVEQNVVLRNLAKSLGLTQAKRCIMGLNEGLNGVNR